MPMREAAHHGGGLAVTDLILEQQRLMLAREDQLRHEMSQQVVANKAEMEAHMSQLRTEFEPAEAVSAGQLEALGAI
jgi:hypothetical protein